MSVPESPSRPPSEPGPRRAARPPDDAVDDSSWADIVGLGGSPAVPVPIDSEPPASGRRDAAERRPRRPDEQQPPAGRARPAEEVSRRARRAGQGAPPGSATGYPTASSNGHSTGPSTAAGYAGGPAAGGGQPRPWWARGEEGGAPVTAVPHPASQPLPPVLPEAAPLPRRVSPAESAAARAARQAPDFQDGYGAPPPNVRPLPFGASEPFADAFGTASSTAPSTAPPSAPAHPAPTVAAEQDDSRASWQQSWQRRYHGREVPPGTPAAGLDLTRTGLDAAASAPPAPPAALTTGRGRAAPVPDRQLAPPERLSRPAVRSSALPPTVDRQPTMDRQPIVLPEPPSVLDLTDPALDRDTDRSVPAWTDQTMQLRSTRSGRPEWERPRPAEPSSSAPLPPPGPLLPTDRGRQPGDRVLPPPLPPGGAPGGPARGALDETLEPAERRGPPPPLGMAAPPSEPGGIPLPGASAGPPGGPTGGLPGGPGGPGGVPGARRRRNRPPEEIDLDRQPPAAGWPDLTGQTRAVDPTPAEPMDLPVAASRRSRRSAEVPPEPGPDSGQTSRAGRNLPMAIGVGLLLAALALGSLLFRKEAFVGLVSLAVVLSVWELCTALSSRVTVPMVPLAVGSLGMLVSAFVAGEEGLLVSFTLTVFGMLLWRIIEGLEGAVGDVAGGVFVAAYLPFLAGFALVMLASDDGAYRVLTFLAVAVFSDIGGYVTGVLWGRHPLAPTVSPKKSWEGLAGSVTFCLAVGVVAVVVLLDGPWWAGVALGVATALTATVGDLAESLLKRDLGVKDMGWLLPGHGGIMDRIDSLLITAPVAYLLLRLLVPVVS